DEEEASKEDDEEEKEEHLAPTDSTATTSPVVNPVPSAEETEPFKTNESAATPPSPHAEVARLLAIPTPPPSPLTPLSSPLSQIPLTPFPAPSPPTTSPTYAEASLGYKAVGIQFKTTSPPPLPSPLLPPPSSPLLPPVDHREEVPKADIPPQKRLCLTAPTPRFEVGESSTAAAAKQPGLGATRTTTYGFVDMVDYAPRRYVPREVGYGNTETWDELVDAIQERASMTLEGVDAIVNELAETHKRDTQDLYAHLEDAQDIRARLSDRVDILIKDRQLWAAVWQFTISFRNIELTLRYRISHQFARDIDIDLVISSDEASSGVTYTSISSDYEEPSDTGSPGVIIYGYDGLLMHPVDPSSLDYMPDLEEPEQAPLSPDYVPGPEYPEYLAPSNAEIHNIV
nr:hypothetical protein [Tanacetum cinerariifolium]